MYKISYNYILNRNAFALIVRGSRGEVESLYPIVYNNVEYITKDGINYYRFMVDTLLQPLVIKENDVIHVKTNVVKDVVFGSYSNAQLQILLDLLGKNNQSLINAINSNGQIKGVFALDTNLNEDDLVAASKRFANNYLSSDSDGIITLQKSETFTPVDIVDKHLSSDDYKLLEDRIYGFFGVNRELINCTATDSQWQMYIGTVLEPFFNNLAQEMTYKLMSLADVQKGDSIDFNIIPIKHINTSDKQKYLQFMHSAGALSVNELRAIEGYPPVEGGDVHMINMGGTGTTVGAGGGNSPPEDNTDDGGENEKRA